MLSVRNAAMAILLFFSIVAAQGVRATIVSGSRMIWERTISRLMPKDRKPTQTWMTFLRNHVGQLVSIDFFTVATIRFRILYVFIVLAHDRRRIVHFNVTEHPTALWAAPQIIEAFPALPGLWFGTATKSTVIPSHRESKEWASKKFTWHHGVLGRMATSSR